MKLTADLLYREYPSTKRYKEYKKCNTCNESLHYTSFYIDRQKDGYLRLGHICKTCYKAHARKSKHKSLYGCTEEQVQVLYRESKGVCAICKTPLREPDGSGRKSMDTMHIDHDHSSGVVRGILCHHCNVGLGSFKDNRELLARAIAYLDERS